MDNLHVEIGGIIREYRQKSKMTQLDLAHKLGYDNSQFVSLFERGISKVPLNVLGQLVAILGIPERKIVDSLIKAYEGSLKNEINLGKKSVRNQA